MSSVTLMMSEIFASVKQVAHRGNVDLLRRRPQQAAGLERSPHFPHPLAESAVASVLPGDRAVPVVRFVEQ